MKLVEFALDFQNIKEDEVYIASLIKENGCDIDEAINRFWNEIGRWKRRELENQTKCITSFFARFLGCINTKDTKKLLIKCVPKVQGKAILTFSGGFCDVQVPFDYDYFILLDDLGKKKLTLETLMKGIRMVAADKSWDMEPFERTYVAIVEAGYKNEWIWKKAVRSRDKKHTASVFLRHEISEIEIFLIIGDNKGIEIFREKIISELPSEWAYSEHLGEIKWLDSNKVALVNKKKDKEWVIDF